MVSKSVPNRSQNNLANPRPSFATNLNSATTGCVLSPGIQGASQVNSLEGKRKVPNRSPRWGTFNFLIQEQALGVDKQKRSSHADSMQVVVSPTSIPLLNARQSEQIVARIDRLNALWSKHESASFHTLGLPAYQYASSLDAYFRFNPSINRFIRHHFKDLLFAVQSTLSQNLKKRISFDHVFALPGFHIFTLNGEDSGGELHKDQPYQTLFDYIGYNEPSRVNISFTLPLELPGGTSGLEYLPGEGMRSGLAQSHASREIPLSLHRYRVGELVVFSGGIDHRIAPNQDVKSFGRRISLQGHIVEFENRLIAYW